MSSAATTTISHIVPPVAPALGAGNGCHHRDFLTIAMEILTEEKS